MLNILIVKEYVMSLIEELDRRKKEVVNIKKAVKLRKDIAEDLKYVMDKGISFDELLELALEKLPIKKLVEDLKKMDNKEFKSTLKSDTVRMDM